MPVTKDEMLKAAAHPINESFIRQGITLEYLVKKLKRELNAKEVKVFYDRRTGEVVYSKKLPVWDIRQRARQDAHKLLGHYPAEKHEIVDPATEFLAEILREIHQNAKGLPPLPSQVEDED